MIICQECGKEVEASERHTVDDCDAYKKTIIDAHIKTQNEYTHGTQQSNSEKVK